MPHDPTSGMMVWTLAGEPIYAGVQIPVERIPGPVLVVGAGLDPGRDSPGSVKTVAARLRKHHHAVTALVDAGAGHGIGSVLPYVRTPSVLQTQVGPLPLAGTPAANQAARAAAWQRVLAYLAKL